MSLSIQQNFVTDLENFTWGKDWRAMRIIKEKRTNGEYYFAYVVRYYGEVENTHDYDVGDSLRETAWLGRVEKFTGKRQWITDPNDQTRRIRASSEPITEIIQEEDLEGKPVSREVLVEGKTIYEYTIKVNKENTEKMKTLAGAIALNQETQFLFMYGPVPPYPVDPDTFWDTSVSDYLQQQETIQKKQGNGKKV